MGLLVLLLIVAIVAGGFWYLRHQGRAHSRSAVGAQAEALPAKSEGPPRRPGRMINAGEECCASARKIATAWYPEGDVPRLPLDSCAHPETCKCTWMRVLDRRITHRRSEHDRRKSVRFEDKDDRRSGRDQRKDAGNPWKNA